MQSLTPYVSEYQYLENGGEYNCIAENIDNIKKLMCMQFKICKLILEEKITPTQYAEVTRKYGNKLKFANEIRRLYLNKYKEEALATLEELELAGENRDLLAIRYKIGDIEEIEYQLKIAVHNWDIEHLHKKKLLLEKNMRLLQSVLGAINPEDIEMIHTLSQNNYKAVKALDLDYDELQMFIDDINTIEELTEINIFA